MKDEAFQRIVRAGTEGYAAEVLVGFYERVRRTAGQAVVINKKMADVLLEQSLDFAEKQHRELTFVRTEPTIVSSQASRIKEKNHE